MQEEPTYVDVVAEVKDFLAGRIDAAIEAGIPRSFIVADPGFGFGKTVAHNLRLLRELAAFRELGVPLLAGLSRKSTLGALTGRPVEERLAASIAAATVACLNGADILRVHDVAETRDAVKVAVAVLAAGSDRPGDRGRGSGETQ
jgi:dihydropteroate synthase